MDARGNVALAEHVNFVPGATGRFVGQFSTDQTTLAGTWTSGDGRRTLPFSLRRVAESVELSGGQSNRYKVMVEYLHFRSAEPFYQALNQRLAKEAQARFNRLDALLKKQTAGSDDLGSAAWSKGVNVELIHADKSLVSLCDTSYSFTGGAHFDYNLSSGNWIWDGTRLRELGVRDILKDDPAALKRLRDLCVRDLKRQKAGWPDDLKFDAKIPPPLNLTSAGVLFIFDPYLVSSFADGAMTVLIPYADLRDLIPQTGPAARLADQ